jgi:hypothetical protein
MHKHKIFAVAVSAGRENVSLKNGEQFKFEWLTELKQNANKIGDSKLKLSLENHIQYLEIMSLEDFFRTLMTLETILGMIRLILKLAPVLREIDRRKITLLIDNQNDYSINVLKYFIHYFLNATHFCTQLNWLMTMIIRKLK